jgi:hypothetical protein
MLDNKFTEAERDKLAEATLKRRAKAKADQAARREKLKLAGMTTLTVIVNDKHVEQAKALISLFQQWTPGKVLGPIGYDKETKRWRPIKVTTPNP